MQPKLAIVERLPGHTEVMGGFAALALELGWDVHLMFNPTDAFHVVDYLAAQLGIGAGNIHEWSYINGHAPEFDVILLNTAVVWLDYGYQLQQWELKNRLVVVHHLPDDYELNARGHRLYLTPAVDREKWIFPLYGKPAEPAELAPDDSSVGHDSGLPTLLTIGALDLKDIAGVSAYMKGGGKVVHYDRHTCRFFPGEANYSQHVGLAGVEFMRSLSARRRPVFLWFPIPPESHYMLFRFTGALIMGVDMGCIMVMPEPFRKLYGFPDDAVISYQSSVMEDECLGKLRECHAKQLERQKRLAAWARERWDKNLEIFRRLLGSGQR